MFADISHLCSLHRTPKRNAESSSLVTRGVKHLWCNTNSLVYIKIFIARQVAGIAVPFLLTSTYSSVQSTMLRYHREASVPSEGLAWKGKNGYGSQSFSMTTAA